MKRYSYASHITLQHVDFAIFAVHFQNIRTVNVQGLERIYSNQHTADVSLQGALEGNFECIISSISKQ